MFRSLKNIVRRVVSLRGTFFSREERRDNRVWLLGELRTSLAAQGVEYQSVSDSRKVHQLGHPIESLYYTRNGKNPWVPFPFNPTPPCPVSLTGDPPNVSIEPPPVSAFPLVSVVQANVFEPNHPGPPGTHSILAADSVPAFSSSFHDKTRRPYIILRPPDIPELDTATPTTDDTNIDNYNDKDTSKPTSHALANDRPYRPPDSSRSRSRSLRRPATPASFLIEVSLGFLYLLELDERRTLNRFRSRYNCSSPSSVPT